MTVVRKFIYNPSAILYIANTLVALIVAWNWHSATQEQIAAVDTIVTGVTSIIAVFLVRPVELPVAAAAAVTVLTAFGAFHLKLDPAQITTGVAFASTVIGLILHAIGTPVAAVRQGKTAQQIMMEAGPTPPGVQ